MNIDKLSPLARTGFYLFTVIGSASLCLLLLPTRVPGMEILGVGPSWLVMWAIVWSLRGSLWHATGAGVVLGLIQDGMTFLPSVSVGTTPTHVVSLTTVSVLAFVLYKRRYVDDTIVSVSIATFLLTIISESITGLQYLAEISSRQSPAFSLESSSYLWHDRLLVIPIAALLSSLWMPVLYYPLSLCWQKMFADSKLT
jgi:rod shape-determining protein MreD